MNNVRYMEMKRLSSDSVRSLCISKNWYTRGDVESYSKLLNKVCDIENSENSITVDQLAEIAEDILKHSDTNYYVESIMWELNRVADTFFYKAN